jgi:hypothetical protein
MAANISERGRKTRTWRVRRRWSWASALTGVGQVACVVYGWDNSNRAAFFAIAALVPVIFGLLTLAHLRLLIDELTRPALRMSLVTIGSLARAIRQLRYPWSAPDPLTFHGFRAPRRFVNETMAVSLRGAAQGQAATKRSLGSEHSRHLSHPPVPDMLRVAVFGNGITYRASLSGNESAFHRIATLGLGASQDRSTMRVSQWRPR